MEKETVIIMVFEIIGKVMLYILVTLTAGLLIDNICGGTRSGFGPWLAGIVIFIWLNIS